MIYIKVGETLYPATIRGKMVDHEWDDRQSKEITLEMDYTTAISTFVDGIEWSIVQRENVIVEEPVYKVDDETGENVLDDDGNYIQIDVIRKTEERDVIWNNSEYCIAGDITDHRDGNITVKMGKLTELEEAYVMLLGGIE